MQDALGSAITNTDPNSCVTLQSDRFCKPWRLSTDGYTFMAVLESGMVNGTYRGKRVADGFIVQVYDDGFGIPTVGFGHKVLPQDNLRIGDVISVERARSFFDVNLLPVEEAINRELKVPLYQYEYDALVSVLFNSGPNHKPHDPWPGTCTQYLASFLNKGAYAKMPSVIRKFIDQRVPWRRRLEAKLFETGIYDAQH
ncbi:lysozyme [Paraburkholderia youngii]|uniref:Lysozyme n=1 Tax=Paraburkholderia youngii TaxID=2782701 RepID=A0ABX2NTR9_9BURK|nr:lysozyme [Paraburkholderia youngii]NVI07453.1 lysozyme [Paraburkholderia youngii]